MKHSMRVRKASYRGRDGYTVKGHPPGSPGGFPLSIFVRLEVTARQIVAVYKQRLPLELERAQTSALILGEAKG